VDNNCTARLSTQPKTFNELGYDRSHTSKFVNRALVSMTCSMTYMSGIQDTCTCKYMRFMHNNVIVIQYRPDLIHTIHEHIHDV
jgi:hypothetical protein